MEVRGLYLALHKLTPDFPPSGLHDQKRVTDLTWIVRVCVCVCFPRIFSEDCPVQFLNCNFSLSEQEATTEIFA